MLGPIDYIVVGFEGNNFDGSVLQELEKASDSGVIRVVDLLFVMKDSEGSLAIAEVRDQPEELKQSLAKLGFNDDMPLLTEDDLFKIAESLDNDTSAGVLVIEHLWAKGLKKALMDKGAKLLDEGRIHPEAIDAILEDLEQLDDEEK